MSTTVAAVRAHPDRYEKDFDAVVAFLTQYIDKKTLTASNKVASVTQTRPAKRQKISTSHGIFRGLMEVKSTPEKSMTLYLHSASSYMNSGKELGS